MPFYFIHNSNIRLEVHFGIRMCFGNYYKAADEFFYSIFVQIEQVWRSLKIVMFYFGLDFVKVYLYCIDIPSNIQL